MGNQKVKKERLDVMLVEQGFFDSRENAKRHIMAGIILVNDVPVDKAGTKIPVDAKLRIKGHVMPYVGRGGYKLEKAIKTFGIDMKGKVMADIGASTGGFTDCALQNGRRRSLLSMSGPISSTGSSALIRRSSIWKRQISKL